MKDIPKYLFYAFVVAMMAYGFQAGWFKQFGGKLSKDSIEIGVKR